MAEIAKFDDPKFMELMDKIGAMFLEFGIRNLNMDDISRNLKISKKTLYQYFKNKEDLIEKIFEFDDIKRQRLFDEMCLQQHNAIEILFIASSMVAREMNQMNPKVKFELKKYYEPISSKFMEQKKGHILEEIGKNIRKGIEEGLYRSDINIELISGLYVKNITDMHQQDFWFVENITHKQIFEAMFETLIRSIATAEGIAYFEMRKAEVKGLNKDLNK
jgi:AcrR family transcriptional regulator